MTNTTNQQKNQADKSFNYGFSSKEQEKFSNISGSASVALLSNIASKKTSLQTLFPEGSKESSQLKQMVAIDQAKLINREGKPVALTATDIKHVIALSHFLTQYKDSEEIQKYVKSLQTGRASGSLLNSSIVIPINVAEFTKFVSTDGKARARQKQTTIDQFKKLSEIKQVQTYGKGEDKVQFIAPLIHIKEELVDLSPEKRLDLDIINIEFGRLFFYKLYNEYAIIKPSLFQIWGKMEGTKNELFSVLLSDLLSKYSGHRIASINATKGIKQSQYKTEESYFKAINKLKKEALTYSEMEEGIKQRITTDYTSTRVQKSRFKKDLDLAILALRSYGLITEAYRTETKEGVRINFVFNPDYHKQQETIIESILPLEPESPEE